MFTVLTEEAVNPGMTEHQDYARHMTGPANTLPTMMGDVQFGTIKMGDDITSYEDAGWYEFPAGSIARRAMDDD